MILDYEERLSDYGYAGFDADAVQAFIRRAEEEKLPAGRYELDGEKLFAMIQEYETKNPEQCLYESHKRYGDIQYMEEGTEIIYASHISGLAVSDDRTPKEDIIFYDRKEPEGTLLLKKGMFAVFLPQDGHMPCCMNKKPEKVRKIVVKFLLKEA